VAVRITKTSNHHGTILRVDGHLRSEDVGELVREYRSLAGPAVLELSDLQSADSVGVRTLSELVSLGVEIHGASPYISLLLEKTC